MLKSKSMLSGKYDIKRILIIRTSAFGDIILSTPLVRALKENFPEAELDFFTKKEYEILFKHHPYVRVISFDTGSGISGLLRALKNLRAQRYDLVIDLQVNPRSILIRYFSSARMQRRTRKYSLRRRLLRWGINLLRDAEPVPERYFRAVEDFGIKPNGRGPEVYFSREELAEVKAILSQEDLGEMSLIGLAPSASKFTKQWPRERFAEAGAVLAKELSAGILVLGGKGDERLGEEILSLLKSRGIHSAINLAGRLSILGSACVLSLVKLLLSNDSALMHLATAVNTPVVGIFGSTTKELGFFPYSSKARVVEVKGLDCRPCSLHGRNNCPKGHFRCMLDISPEQVIDAGRILLRENQD